MSFSYNPYKRLLGLLPSNPLQVGDVVSTSNGVAIIQLPGGGKVSARGDAAPGARVFFRGGAIEGPAPSLPFVTVDV